MCNKELTKEEKEKNRKITKVVIFLLITGFLLAIATDGITFTKVPEQSQVEQDGCK